MKTFHCQCGSRVFFENTACLTCGRALGFDTDTLDLLSLDTLPDGLLAAISGRQFRRCGNFFEHGNCNWLVPSDSGEPLCASCRLNQIIPALSKPGNLDLWTRVEQAKRRLLYSLLSLGLPLKRSGAADLRFRIMEDRRRNPDVFETFVATAHLDGTITINIAEADDATRHAVREQMMERYRTVLGHLRHESGHFYFSLLTAEPGALEECRALFGDERADYEAALRAHYEAGPPPDWRYRFVSAYAAAHPTEDFAETFAHLLHIHDALESARTAGLVPKQADDGGSHGIDGRNEGGDGEHNDDSDEWLGDWIELAITLNEIGRSLGSGDTYPFVLTEPVKAKLAFMNRVVRRRAERSDG